MTQPADPPPDPDAGLTDEQEASKNQFKGWFREAFSEAIAAEREKEEPAPERTKKPFTWFDGLFGGAGT